MISSSERYGVIRSAILFNMLSCSVQLISAFSEMSFVQDENWYLNDFFKNLVIIYKTNSKVATIFLKSRKLYKQIISFCNKCSPFKKNRIRPDTSWSNIHPMDFRKIKIMEY